MLLVAYEVVLKASYLKFTVSEKAVPLRASLLQTGDSELVEASADKIWGCGLALKAAQTFKGKKWPGQNLLGKALMEIRERLREEEAVEQAEEQEGTDEIVMQDVQEEGKGEGKGNGKGKRKPKGEGKMQQEP